ncbi:MAG: FmdB family zinc ribbon protein [Mycobacterium sp.]|nr:FmdB family zinc ribbon protein [Mycobacterium sp.]
MPTYSYACTECDNRFDEVQAFSDDALTTCPKCNGRLRKLFGKVGVVFKGSGFYRNDSRDSSKSSSTASAATSSDGSSSAGSSSSGSSDTASPSSSSGSSPSGSSSSGSSSSSSSSTPAAASS